MQKSSPTLTEQDNNPCCEEEGIVCQSEEEIKGNGDDSCSPNESTSVKSRNRCHFWPSCRSGDSCIFYHPTEPCKLFPNCYFGDRCLYIHPSPILLCKFDAVCTRQDCKFSHTTPKNSSLPAASTTVKSPVAQPLTRVVQPCRYFPNCSKVDCSFYHPAQTESKKSKIQPACRFGHLCSKVDCSFVHSPDALAPKDKMKWAKTKNVESLAVGCSPAMVNAPPKVNVAQYVLASQLLSSLGVQAGSPPQALAAQLLNTGSGENVVNSALMALAHASMNINQQTATTSSSLNVPSTVAVAGSSTSKDLKVPQQPLSSDEEDSDEEDDSPSGIQGVAWKSAKGGKVPGEAVEGGKNHLGPIYVARFQHNGKLVPGKLIPSYGSCYITWKTKEFRSKDYEVLCESNTGWLSVKEGDMDAIPKNAIIGGFDEDGDPLYIGRVEHGQHITVGKVEAGESMTCYILYGGVEHDYNDFELLVSTINTSTKRQSSSKSGHSKISLPSNSDTPWSRNSGQSAKPNSSFFSSYKKPNSRVEEHVQEIVKAVNLKESFTKINPAATKLPESKVETKPDINFKLITLATDDTEFISVSQKMQKTIKQHPGILVSQYNIIKVEKVWNTKLWKLYSHHSRKIMEENNDKLNERRLFHGSPNSLDIVEKGFDERHASVNGMFGAGVYFADHSSKSNQYAYGLGKGCKNHKDASCKLCPRLMMICRVALGKIAEHTSRKNYAHAPPGHHSVKGVPGSSLNYPEYIIYRGEQALPEFLITYTIM